MEKDLSFYLRELEKDPSDKNAAMNLYSCMRRSGLLKPEKDIYKDLVLEYIPSIFEYLENLLQRPSMHIPLYTGAPGMKEAIDGIVMAELNAALILSGEKGTTTLLILYRTFSKTEGYPAINQSLEIDNYKEFIAFKRKFIAYVEDHIDKKSPFLNDNS